MVQIISKLESLSSLNKNNAHYVIPAYQRLYVWQKEQIEKFFNDIISSFDENENNKYFIGNIIFLDNNNKNYDIVDGQQRFTTLFLLLKVIYDLNLNTNLPLEKDIKDNLKNILFRNENFTIKCYARKFADDFFVSNHMTPTTVEKNDNNNEEEKKNKETLENAYRLISNNLETYFKEKDKKVYNDLVKFLINNIKFSVTIVPKGIDVNQLFETMNTTSVQLEQHQVLKARILSYAYEKNNINYKLYANIWDFVSNMNRNIVDSKKTLSYILNHIEKENNIFSNAIKNIIDEIKSIKDENNIEDEGYNNNTENLSDDKDNNTNCYIPLIKLIKDPDIINTTTPNKKNNDKKDENTLGSIKSIINFPYFLLHTLRLFFLFTYNDNNKELFDDLIVDDKKLIKIFENTFIHKSDKNIESKLLHFFSLLIINRYIFDKFIIKWNEDNLTISANFDDNFFMLQSMIYHSQSERRYWLTPLLYNIINLYNKEEINKNINEEIYKNLLKAEHILYNTCYKDNYHESKNTLMFCYDNINDSKKKYKNSYDNKYLKEKLGTKFAHYIFYKLEFIIYYFFKNINLLNNEEELKKLLKNINNKYKKQIKEYKITSKNSIEHIIPQSDNKVKTDIKDSFGNLVLLSVSMNSSYSNNEFNIKKMKFTNKLKRNEIESLKSLITYTTNEYFNSDNIKKHCNDMIKLIDIYHQEIIN